MLTSRNLSSESVQIWATLLVALSGILYGFIGYFGTKILNENFSVTAMLFWRFFAAFIWITGFTLWKKEKFVIKDLNKKIIITTFLLGFIFYSLSSAFYFIASEHTGTGLAMVIFFSYPVFVALIGWITKKSKMNIFAASSLIAIIFGLFLLKGHGESSLNLIGILFAVTSAATYAFYVIGSKKGVGFLPTNLLTILVCLGNAAFFLIASLINHSFIFPATFSTWGYVIALGIIATALPIQLLLDGLTFVSPLKASILSVLEPVITLLVGVALLHESISHLQIIGIFVILTGAMLIQFERG